MIAKILIATLGFTTTLAKQGSLKQEDTEGTQWTGEDFIHLGISAVTQNFLLLSSPLTTCPAMLARTLDLANFMFVGNKEMILGDEGKETEEGYEDYDEDRKESGTTMTDVLIFWSAVGSKGILILFNMLQCIDNPVWSLKESYGLDWEFDYSLLGLTFAEPLSWNFTFGADVFYMLEFIFDTYYLVTPVIDDNIGPKMFAQVPRFITSFFFVLNSAGRADLE